DEDVDPATPGDQADELAEIGPVLERREDAPQLLALGELGLVHDVEQAIAVNLVDGGPVRLAQRPGDPLGNAADENSFAAVGPVELLAGTLGGCRVVG